MADPFENLDTDALLASMQFQGSMQLSKLSEVHPEIVDGMENCHPIKTASMFSALLTLPHLQASCIFLEALVALSLIHCKGKRKPQAKEVKQWFDALDSGPSGRMVDPSEDLFTTTLFLNDEEHSVFEGVWEGGGFYANLAISAISFPSPSSPLEDVRTSILALLKLSSEVVKRRDLKRYEYGASDPIRSLSMQDAQWARANKSVISFTIEELEQLGVAIEDLADFGFLPEYRDKLINTVNGHSPLDRYPLAHENGVITILAPTAITAAVRLFIVEFSGYNDALTELSGLLANTYADLFSRVGVFGASNRSGVEFEHTPNGFVAGIVKQIDLGRWLNVVFVADAFDGFQEGGLITLANDPLRFDEEINAAIDHAYSIATEATNFREMITLSVGCGIGRAISHHITAKERDNWRHEFVSGYDLFVMSQMDKTSPLLLWHLLDAQDTVHQNELGIRNINGLINLLAWSRSLDGHLIPHESMPDDFHGDHAFMLIDQNAQKGLRFEVAKMTDRRLLDHPYGETLEVRKINEYLIPSEADANLYAHEDFIEGRGIPLAYVAQNDQVWWVELSTPSAKGRNESYARWQMLKTWLPRIAEGLRDHIPSSRSPLLLHATFNGNLGDGGQFTEPGSLDEALEAISVEVDTEKRSIYLEVGEGFEHAIYNAENVAERALISRVVEGFIRLHDLSVSDEVIREITTEIVPNADARQTHRYASMEVRDRLRHALPARLIKTSRIDEGSLKLGLGWRSRERSQGALVKGVEECTQLLANVVRELSADLRVEISRYSKEALLQMCLVNHEIAAVERQQWRRTSKAILALRNHSLEAREVIIKNEFELNAISASCRFIAEMAVCEAPDEDALLPGKLDFGRMMTRAMMIYQLGNNSNSIRWGAMEPVIRITPQGDIHANHDFTDDVVQPFAVAGANDSIDKEIKRYSKRVTNKHRTTDADGLSDEDFEAAWLAELGGTIKQFQILVESIEDRAIVQNRPFVRERLSELAKVSTDIGQLDLDTATVLLETLLLRPRGSWDEIPDHCQDKDIRFWRYKRQLSLIRRPLVALSDDKDPVVLVAPGMLRESFVYLVGHYHMGGFPEAQLRSKEMRRYAAKLNDQKGKEFELKVRDKLEAMGWKTYHGRKLTEIFGKPLDRDYGDIDVIAVSPDKMRVLVIECKDLMDRQTPGDIAELISKFQGNESDGKRDLLRKHLDRVEKLLEQPQQLHTFCSSEPDARIEGWLVFSDTVPMQWAWGQLAEKSKIAVFRDLEQTVS